MKKPQKSELGKALKTYGQEIDHLDSHNEVFVFDFMAQARKLPINKMKLCTFGDFTSALCTYMSKMSINCKRIDVVFDCYSKNGTKTQEHQRRDAEKNV